MARRYEGDEFGGEGFTEGGIDPEIMYDEHGNQIAGSGTVDSGGNKIPTALDGAKSPGPGDDDGLESGTTNIRINDNSTTRTTMSRRPVGPASTMLQGSRKLG